MHSFTLTGGIKFGADMMAYPGDPSLYHAQVRREGAFMVS